jgi:hypothetical protein
MDLGQLLPGEISAHVADTVVLVLTPAGVEVGTQLAWQMADNQTDCCFPNK